MLCFYHFLSVIECNYGTYGYNCVNNCSGHCLNYSPCNKQTGHCDDECKPGYTDTNCSKGNLNDLVLFVIIFSFTALMFMISS